MPQFGHICILYLYFQTVYYPCGHTCSHASICAYTSKWFIITEFGQTVFPGALSCLNLAKCVFPGFYLAAYICTSSLSITSQFYHIYGNKVISPFVCLHEEIIHEL